MAKEKKEFAWDSEVVIKVIEKSEKEKHEVKICTLNGKSFVVDTKLAYFQKDGWKPVKNTTLEMSLFNEVVGAVSEWNLKAFKDSKVAVAMGKAAETKEKQAKDLKKMKDDLQKQASEEKPKNTRKTK